MTVRTTIDVPRELHDALRARAEQTGTSIRSLVIGAIEPKKGAYVTGPLVTGPGKLGPSFPQDENP